MLYLFIDQRQIKLLVLKKTLLGQYESAFYEKTHQIDLLQEGQIASTDLLASAIKESINATLPQNTKEKDICVILPQDSFHFIRTAVPADIAPSATDAFIKEKARSQISVDLNDTVYDYTIQETNKEQEILFYAITKEALKKYQEAFSLLGLQIQSVIPEALAYFKLFEKTLRKDKKEHIFYVSYQNEEVAGYLYDSFGLLDTKKWSEKTSLDKIESLLHDKVAEYEANGKKINRLILSGEKSDTIRQDTFTKNVGAWTNPLKRIIPQFYQDYLKLLVIPENKTLPLLVYDVCIGAFIFSLENKNFSLLKKRFNDVKQSSNNSPRNFKLPLKEIGIFLASFILSFILLLLISRSNFNIGNLNFLANRSTPSPTPTLAPPSPTPTPKVDVDRSTIRVKILNGSGIAGKASEVSAILEEKGYEEILTGNADSFDYEQTEIQVKDKSHAAVITEDLKENVTDPKITDLDEEDASDIIIIFGTDFK